jgi:hypothetical protein
MVKNCENSRSQVMIFQVLKRRKFLGKPNNSRAEIACEDMNQTDHSINRTAVK